LLLAAIVPVVLVLGACGSSDTSSTGSATGASGGAQTTASGGSTTTASAPAGEECGTVPEIPPKDPDGIIASLGEEQQEAANGFPVEITKSAWADFQGKPKPWKVGRVSRDGITGYGVELRKQSEAEAKVAKENGFVSEFNQLDLNETTAAAELAGYRAMVRQNPDVIITGFFNPKAVTKEVTAAGKKGILTVSIGTILESPYAVNLSVNWFTNVAKPVAATMRQIGGKGNVLIVHGVPGATADVFGDQAIDAVLGRCPDVKVVGEVNGSYVPALAKTEILKFLASHPGKIDAVIQVGVMGSGIIEAFEQSGRPMPAISTLSLQGDLSYWLDHLGDGFKGSGNGGNGNSQMNALWRMLSRILDGRGPKANTIIVPPITIDEDNLKDYADSGVPLDSPASAKGDPGTWAPDEYMDGWFEKPGTPEGADTLSSGQ